MKRFLRRVVDRAGVQIIAPAVIGLGLIAWISSIASAPRSGGELWQIVEQTWYIVLLLTLPYLAARAIVWLRLLHRLHINVPLRQAAVAFAGGEITKSLPAGIYMENYLLNRLVRFGRQSTIRSSMATTATLGLESLIAVPIAMIVGVPGEPWLFWLLLGIVLAWVAIIALAWVVLGHWLRMTRHRERSLLYRTATAVEEFLAAGRELIVPATLVDLLPTAAYMFVYMIDLWVILRALGLHSISLLDAVSIYSVIVLAVILIPIPTELGITELTGLGVLMAYHVNQATAALAVLALRLLATGGTILVAGTILLLLRDQFTGAGEDRTEIASA